MSIQDQLQQLYELSRIDRAISKIRGKIGDAPKRRDELMSRLQIQESQITGKKAALGSLEKEKSGVESELQFSKDRLAAFESKINQIKTNKEYQAALKEIAETKNAQKQMEDRILKWMTDIGDLQKEMGQLQSDYDSERKKGEDELKNLADLEIQIAQETRDLEEKRKGLLEKVDAGLRSRYERILASRQSAVALVVKGACQECNMRLAPQLVIEIQRFAEIHSCPSCHRMLYLEGGTP